MLVHLRLAVVLSTISQTRHALLPQSLEHPIHPRNAHAHRFGNRPRLPSLARQKHDLATVGQAFIAGLSPHPTKLDLDTMINS